MSDSPVNLRPSGPPDTVLPAAPTEAATALVGAMSLDGDPRREAVADVVARWPRFVEGWATIGEMTPERLERYAYFRVGYHRGLDALRGSGWRGSGYVRWRHESNRGFLRALSGLGESAAAIGEDDEVERITQFLIQLDPEHFG